MHVNARHVLKMLKASNLSNTGDARLAGLALTSHTQTNHKMKLNMKLTKHHIMTDDSRHHIRSYDIISHCLTLYVIIVIVI